ncbi:hypothetical protein Bca52824_043347 [Brassica carinata]|uniref:Uncharacterized protein n=1 Tax=Brassica carinata TaxID=52824 RepID=A0A8X7P0T7_BRACI|nr:hypothetical protein Bca52824_096159 [Brassica carinata]KAG2296678.1 hypothetical protein Bca52824_043347 [Brassica carinata]
METPTHFISISLGRHHRCEGSSSYDQNDKIQGEKASEPCLAGKKRKETERLSSALPPITRKLVAHKVKVC